MEQKIASIPSAPVDNPESYYLNHVLSMVRSDISIWNENVVFNLKECMDIVRAFWYIRYNAVYPINIVAYPFSTCFFNSVFGIDNYLSPEIQKFVEENRNEILSHSSIASATIVSLSKEGYDLVS